MSIRIENKESIKINSKDKANMEVSKSFSQILNTEKNNAEENEKEILNKKISTSVSLKMFNKILQVDNKKGRKMSLKDNGKVDVVKMLKEYGDDLDTRKLNELVSVLGGLKKEGLIDDEDYFYAMKWIMTKIHAKSIEINIYDKESKTILSMDGE